MNQIQIKDKRFAVSIPEADILKEVDRVAAEINRDLAGKNPLFLSVLNGSFMFTADLMKRITIPCEVSFVKLASYQGVTSTGKVKEVIGITEDLTDRTIVIVEDIVDTGLTMQRLLETLGTRRPKEIHIATLLVKPEKLKVDLDIKYVAMQDWTTTGWVETTRTFIQWLMINGKWLMARMFHTQPILPLIINH